MAAAANPQLQWGLKNMELWLECFTGQSQNTSGRGEASTRTPPSSSQQFHKPCTYCFSTYHFPDNCPRNPFHFKSTPSDSSASRPLPRDRKGNLTHPGLVTFSPSALTSMELAVPGRSATFVTNVAPVRVITPDRIAPFRPPPAPDPQICTPLRPLEFECELVSYPNKDFVCHIVLGIRYGFKIGCAGPQFAHTSPNLPSAYLQPKVIDETLHKECKAGRIAGPFSYPPLAHFRSSGVGLVPKKDGGWRMIHHLSAPSGSSVNDYINQDVCSLSYTTINDATSSLIRLDPGSWMAKMDLKSAFCLCPVLPTDQNFLGLYWNGYYYYDKCLPFGLRSAPFLFNNIGRVIEWCIRNRGLRHLIRYLDDFLTLGAPQSQECSNNKSVMLEVCQLFNIPVNLEKTSGPAQCIEFLGIMLDSVKMEASISLGRRDELLTDLSNLAAHRTCKKCQLLQLIGKLSFACKVVPAGRMFLRRLINKSMEVGPMNHHISLCDETKADLQWWLAFLPAWSGTSILIDPVLLSPTHHQLFTDASSQKGYGAYWNGKWFGGQWDLTLLTSITWKELYTVVLAASTWGHEWRGQSILFHCDNRAVIEIWQKGSCKHQPIMALVRILYIIAALFQFRVLIQHIPGTNNAIADALSRFQVLRFCELAPLADPNPTDVVPPKSHCRQEVQCLL